MRSGLEAGGGGEYVLLGRMEGEVPGYLSYGAQEGEVLCVFRGVAEAEAFYERWWRQIPGEGWRAERLDAGELRAVLKNFDLVSLDPDPVPGSTEYLHTVDDFTRSLTSPGG